MEQSPFQDTELGVIATGVHYIGYAVGGIATLTFMVEGFVGDVAAQNTAGDVIYGAAAVSIAARVGRMALPRIYNAAVNSFMPPAGPER